MINNIKNNINSEISAKKGLNALNEIIKYEKHTPKQKELLNLFNHLSDTILTEKTLKSKSQKDKNDKTLMSSNEDNENENENDKTLMSSNEDDDDEIIKILISSNETMNQNKKNIITKILNNHLDKIIGKS